METSAPVALVSAPVPPVKLEVTFVSEIPEVALPEDEVEESEIEPAVALSETAAALVAVTAASLTGRRCGPPLSVRPAARRRA